MSVVRSCCLFRRSLLVLGQPCIVRLGVVLDGDVGTSRGIPSFTSLKCSNWTLLDCVFPGQVLYRSRTVHWKSRRVPTLMMTMIWRSLPLRKRVQTSKIWESSPVQSFAIIHRFWNTSTRPGWTVSDWFCRRAQLMICVIRPL